MRRSHLPAESVLAVDDLKLDRVERRVERAGRRIELTSKEFCLLEYLMRNAGRRITRAMIIEHVWNLSFDTCTNVVDVYQLPPPQSGRWVRQAPDSHHPGSRLRTECTLRVQTRAHLQWRNRARNRDSDDDGASVPDFACPISNCGSWVPISSTL